MPNNKVENCREVLPKVQQEEKPMSTDPNLLQLVGNGYQDELCTPEEGREDM